MQPVVIAEDGYVRFQGNKLVRHLLDWASERGCSLNDLSLLDGIPRSDWEQFAQLIGYSVSGFGSLSYVRGSTYDKALKKQGDLLTETTADGIKYAPIEKP
jgi:hypothetical protein